MKPGNGPLVLFVSGGNIDMGVISRIIQRGLAKSGRISNLVVILEDRPGALAALLARVAAAGANVVTVNHDRLKAGTPVGAVEVEVSLETRDCEHAREILRMLRREGCRVTGAPEVSALQENDPACGIIPEEVRP